MTLTPVAHTLLVATVVATEVGVGVVVVVVEAADAVGTNMHVTVDTPREVAFAVRHHL